MEIAAALLVPVAAVMNAPASEWREAIALGAAMVSVSVLLVIGGLYWRAIFKRAGGEKDALPRVIRAADVAERPILVLLVLAVATLTTAFAARGWTPPVIAAAVLTTLAALEYVNYYRVQLQNFDNLADIRRLLRTHRFRRAHLGRDLQAYRRRRKA